MGSTLRKMFQDLYNYIKELEDLVFIRINIRFSDYIIFTDASNIDNKVHHLRNKGHYFIRDFEEEVEESIFLLAIPPLNIKKSGRLRSTPIITIYSNLGYLLIIKERLLFGIKVQNKKEAAIKKSPFRVPSYRIIKLINIRVSRFKVLKTANCLVKSIIRCISKSAILRAPLILLSTEKVLINDIKVR
ncbi:hypothetical protein B0T13DRAFT_446964 [Neurospora crassa]|nr:hypothetical protein B0T13DRAFT_446964 [Neurospora crassa]